MKSIERTVTIQHNGKTYVGYYTVDGPLLTVRCGKREKSDLLSGASPESLATLLLSEIVSTKEDF